jgi:hypothetical protein
MMQAAEPVAPQDVLARADFHRRGGKGVRLDGVTQDPVCGGESGHGRSDVAAA